MTDSGDRSGTGEQEFDAVVYEYYAAVERGERPLEQDFVRKYPHFAEELRAFFADVHILQELGRQLRDDDLHATRATGGARGGGKPRELVMPGTHLRYIGEYQILGEIARGGMGIIYKARHEKLGRTVALKMILVGEFATTADVERFHREARAAAGLQHPNLVSVHEVGEYSGHHFYTMDYVAGPSLAEILREGSCVPCRAARLLKTVAEVIHYAHEQGVIHRDLKPGNILIAADDQPRVTDFGLAKSLLDSASRQDLTESGQILGTPSYMSPEQAAGRHPLVGVSSDIYSLGAILYACLCGRAPFVGESAVATLRQVIDHEPPPVRALNSSVSKDLEKICLKCLNKEPHRRYGTAEELADDLGRFLEGRPVLALPCSRASKAWRWVKRNPAVASLVALSVMLLLSGTGVSTYFAIEAAYRADDAERASDEAIGAMQEAESNARVARAAESRAAAQAEVAQAERKRALWQTYRARLQPMRQAWLDQEFGHLHRLLEDSMPAEVEPDYRGWEWYFLEDEVNRRFVTIVPESSRFIDAQWSSDGKYLAFRRADGPMEIRDGSNFTLKCTLPGSQQKMLAWHPKLPLLAAAAGSRDIEIWNVEQEQRIESLSTPGPDETTMDDRALAWSRDGTRLAFGGHSRIDLWHWSGKAKHEKTLYSVKSMVGALDWHPDGKRLAVGGASLAALIDSENDNALWMVHQSRVKVFDVEWDPAGTRLATTWAWPAWMIRIYDEQGRATQLPQTSGPMPALAWESQNGSVMSVNRNQSIYFWDAESQTLQRESHLHSSELLSLDWDANRRLGVSVEANGVAKVWSGDPISAPATEIRLPRGLTGLAWARQDHLVASYSTKAVVICDLNAQHVTRRFTAIGNQEFDAIDWHPTEPLLAIQDRSGRVVVMDALTGERLFDQRGSSSDFNRSVAWSPNGRYLAAGSGHRWSSDAKSCVDVWDFKSGAKLCSLGNSSRTRSCVAWSSDSRRLAIGSFSDRRLEVWDVVSQECSLEIEHDYRFWQTAWSPDDRFIAAGAMEGPVLLIDVVTGQSVRELASHNLGIARVMWSSDGNRILTCAEDQTVRLWDAATADELFVFGPGPTIGSIACWSPDGRRIAALSADSVLRIWGSPQLEVPSRLDTLEDGVLATKPLAAQADALKQERLEEKRLQQRLSLAAAHEQQQQFDEAREIYHQLIRETQGRIQDPLETIALARLERIFWVSPVSLHMKLADLERMSGNQEKESETLQAVVAMLTSRAELQHPEDWGVLALAFARLGKLDRGREAYEEMASRLGAVPLDEQARLETELADLLGLLPDQEIYSEWLSLPVLRSVCRSMKSRNWLLNKIEGRIHEGEPEYRAAYMLRNVAKLFWGVAIGKEQYRKLDAQYRQQGLTESWRHTFPNDAGATVYCAIWEQWPSIGKGARIEGESLVRQNVPHGNVWNQDMTSFGEGKWSGNKQLFWLDVMPSSQLKLGFELSEDGEYQVGAVFTTAPNYAIVDVKLDDSLLAEDLDLYRPQVVERTEVLQFGSHFLRAGRHQLLIEIKGANSLARNSHAFGLDYVKLERK